MNLILIDNQLRIELEWYEQLWAFSLAKTLDIPLAHIETVTTDEPQSSWQEIRAPGTFLPGVIKAGTYYTSRGKEFWYVTESRYYLVLTLQDESFKRIVLTLPDCHLWLERISQAKLTISSDL
ncbi:MAG TPA: hypothetical protein DEG17_22915 [Cyanobacteria bacterium UBA11149]|nr:hypothetical protein [Cyanobacteria bacterium UBA11367]HBE57005.1 hypothetical protein [Cyanobacteria bacterium UBA11366]HBK63261.1 hypothetical protein [Cyanobacteria bacterium UBA11166]HBR75261.1 hypothetical protein [Cyanobacteria bacterium UBA11159]HBS71445.1 hypothetical protein [Cyanobacteria bacterium UBA11153]HBW91635.1 hypothetical protein [Cyanobacteria bacterium UBA11149]HCA95564.1 hypothetical protein [Cyanobacteria bacterium UBA9226]